MTRFLRVGLVVAGLLAAGAAPAALVRPYPGYGNFPITVDVAYRWDADGTLDLDVMVEVRSGHLIFVRPTRDLPFQADLDVSVRLEGDDGVVHEIKRHQPVREQTLERARDTERVNTFTYTLEDVDSAAGDLSVSVVDRHQERRGRRGWREHPRAFSEMHAYWVAPRPPSEFGGFSLGDPLFLRDYADVDLFGRRVLRGLDDIHAAMLDHIHLAREYGLRQRALQFAFRVYPPDAERAAILDHAGLRVQVVARELRFAMEDTIRFDDAQKTRLGLGEPVAIFHQIDVESLPPGTYLLSCAPLDGKGRPWVTEFDVVWSLGAPRRRGDEELALAKLLLGPEQADVFRGADPVARRDMLDAFWTDLDPVEETPQNEAWIEFQERVAYVRQHLGGFGLDGSLDPRAEVYLLMGTPSRVVFEDDSSNEAERTDPDRDRWTDFEPFIDTRANLDLVNRIGMSPSMYVKAYSANDVSVQSTGPGQQSFRFPGSRIDPMENVYGIRLAKHSRANTPGGEPVSETWYYTHGGFPLFQHVWADGAPRGYLFGYDPDAAGWELRKEAVLETEVYGVHEKTP